MDDPQKTVSPSVPEPAPDGQPSNTVEPTVTPLSTGTSPDMPPLNQAVTSGPKRPWLKWLLILAVVAAVLIGAYFALNHSKKNNQPTVQSAKKSVALLRIGVTQPFPSAFYPKSESSIFPVEVMGQIFEGLTKFQNGSQVVPNLAQSWTNPNNTTWDFKLVSGVKFHDGNDLTAQAVKDSLDALQNTDVGSSYGTTIKAVTVKDASTVEITTTSPDPLLPTELANLWIYDTKSGKDNDPSNGTGPYTLKTGTSLSDKSVDLVAVSNYHGGTPMTKELQFKLYSDTDTAAADAKKGLLDMVETGSQSAAGQLSSAGFKPYADENLQVNMIVPNSLKAGSPMAKLAVRKAVYEALDPTAIMKADNREGTIATQIVPQSVPGYNPAIKAPKTDAAQAKTDLAAAGYPNGFSTSLTYYSTHQAVAAEIQKELAAAGVTLTLDPQTDGPTLGKKAFGGKTDMFYLGYTTNLVDSSDVIQPLLIDTPNYKNTQLDTVYAQAAKTFDASSRVNLLQQANKIVMDDVGVLPLYTPGPLYFAAKSNLVIHTDNLTDYAGVDFWKVYAQ